MNIRITTMKSFVVLSLLAALAVSEAQGKKKERRHLRRTPRTPRVREPQPELDSLEGDFSAARVAAPPRGGSPSRQFNPLVACVDAEYSDKCDYINEQCYQTFNNRPPPSINEPICQDFIRAGCFEDSVVAANIAVCNNLFYRMTDASDGDGQEFSYDPSRSSNPLRSVNGRGNADPNYAPPNAGGPNRVQRTDPRSDNTEVTPRVVSARGQTSIADADPSMTATVTTTRYSSTNRVSVRDGYDPNRTTETSPLRSRTQTSGYDPNRQGSNSDPST